MLTGLLIGLFIGANVGLFIAALCKAAGRRPEDETALKLQAAYDEIAREEFIEQVKAEARQFARGERSE